MSRSMRTLATAMLRGFVRDRTALFFTVAFPLFFLVLFGGLFKDQGTARAKVIEIGQVAVLDAVPAADRGQLDAVFDISHESDPAKAVQAVKDGDYTAAIEQRGDQIMVHFSAADGVRAATVRGVLDSLVNQANIAATGVPPKLSLDQQQVEDHSLKSIQYITPGLLGWAIASGATFGAAATLVMWRDKKILRRLRLAPVRTSSIAGARVLVSLGVALVQTAVFLVVASTPAFGLKLSANWWMSIPVILVATMAFLSIGLLAGAVARTQEAANLIANLVVTPMAFLSGSFFPLDSAPAWLRAVSNVMPLKHLNSAMLDVMVRGKSPVSVLGQMGILAAFAIVFTALATKLFRWDEV